MIDTLEGCGAIQKGVDSLESWAEMRFNKDKCRVLLLGRNNHKHQCGLGADLLEMSSAVKDVGVLVDNRLAVS